MLKGSFDIEHLSKNCEDVLKAINQLQKMQFSPTIDFINVATKGKYAKNEQVGNIIIYLMEGKYIYDQSRYTENYQHGNSVSPIFLLTELGESYFELKRRRILFIAGDWVKSIICAIVGAIITLVVNYFTTK